ncbi:MAG: hypothetical protein V7644_1354 [Actinomycetota bacterium]
MVLLALVVLGVVGSASIASATPLPSGERSFHNVTLEPAYNAENAGQIGYLSTPNKAPMHANPVAWSPLYVVEYPITTTVTETLNCMHVPFENCPSHGDALAGAAASIFPDVYGIGVRGHDHVGDFPGGADFNFAWEPILVLFTNSAAANNHLVTDAQIADAVASHNAIEVPLSFATFNCAWVNVSLWNMATPIATG